MIININNKIKYRNNNNNDYNKKWETKKVNKITQEQVRKN